MRENKVRCSDCDATFSRREFVKAVGATAIAASAVPWLDSGKALAAPSAGSAAETAVKRFYGTLSAQQRKVICFPFDHELRSRISANWAVTKPALGDDFYTKEQREIVREIFKGVTSEDGYERFQKQMQDDQGGFETYHVAVFGEPGTGKFEWEMTGRHLTIRADGDSVEHAAFGGPIIYGHGEESPKSNLFHYQTKKANEVFAALDAKQVEKALLEKAPPESRVPIQGDSGTFPGIVVGELSADQKKLTEEVIKVILAPYRKEDVEEALAVLKSGGGLEKLHMSFYKSGDLEEDRVWDIWRVEGPTFVWHFRGSPHVHTYVNIGAKKS